MSETTTTATRISCQFCGEADRREHMVRTDAVDRSGGRTQHFEHPQCRDAWRAAARSDLDAQQAERRRQSDICKRAATAAGHEPGTLAHTLAAAAEYTTRFDAD